MIRLFVFIMSFSSLVFSENSELKNGKDGSKTSYSVQVSSWKKETSALKEKKVLEKLGYTPYIENFKNSDQNWWRVRLGPYLSKSEAVVISKKLNKTLSKECWIDLSNKKIASYTDKQENKKEIEIESRNNSSTYSKEEVFSPVLSFKDIPIQEEGRVKPLDTFAKNQLLRIYGKRTLSDSNISSTDWLFGVLVGDPKVLSVPVFYILNPEVIYALELDMTDGRKYTFKQISKAIELKIEMLEKIDEKSEEVRTLVEQQLLQIYFNAIHFKMLQSDFTCLTPIIPITNDIIAERLGVKNGENVSFFKFARNLDKMRDFIVSVEQDPVNWS